MRRPPGSTYCFDIWRAAIDRSYNARQLLFIPNSSFLILSVKSQYAAVLNSYELGFVGLRPN